jgi:protein subunit release factor B
VSGTPASLPPDYRLPQDDDALFAECDVSYFRSSGPGGQHKNKTMSSVRLFHRPSGFVAIGKRERSQTRNLQAALARLRERIRRALEKPKPRKKTKPTPASRERRLEEKRRRGRRKEERSDRDWE